MQTASNLVIPDYPTLTTYGIVDPAALVKRYCKTHPGEIRWPRRLRLKPRCPVGKKAADVHAPQAVAVAFAFSPAAPEPCRVSQR